MEVVRGFRGLRGEDIAQYKIGRRGGTAELPFPCFVVSPLSLPAHPSESRPG